MRSPLDERERRWALYAAGLAAVASVALWAPAFNRVEAVILAVLGVLLAGMLALAARTGRRVLTGLAAVLLAFGPWGAAWVIGFPFLCLAAWLLFRRGPGVPEPSDERAQAEEPEKREKRERAEKRPRPSKRGETAGSKRRPPEANKRYTPPQRQR